MTSDIEHINILVEFRHPNGQKDYASRTVDFVELEENPTSPQQFMKWVDNTLEKHYESFGIPGTSPF